jgi:LytS/YehU family sensor histidine kinase
MFGLALTGIYFFIQWRTKVIERREQEKLKSQQEKAELEVKVAQEKAEIERIENELAKSKLETLQAQMNPHFAYNALTSIQKFILKKDNKTANKYLVKFARLMRLFLESSKESFVSLEREIELLQLYIEMEQLRFKDKFEVVYAIDPNVNILEIPIPSMLLQIFVENAINHGLVYKEGKGQLKFAVEQHKNEVWCIVEDDGIGRKKAQEIKKQTTGAYKSLGMKISRERVKYLNITENTQVQIQIDDEILGEGNGGTRVIVKIK